MNYEKIIIKINIIIAIIMKLSNKILIIQQDFFKKILLQRLLLLFLTKFLNKIIKLLNVYMP